MDELYAQFMTRDKGHEFAHPAFQGLRADVEPVTVAILYKEGKEDAMTTDGPDAAYYFEKATESFEGDLQGLEHCFARGLYWGWRQ